MAGKPDDHEVHKTIGSWPAHNNTASNSNGPWLPGKYRYNYYKAHAEEGLMPGCHHGGFGCFGVHIFNVPGRSGLGVHARRSNGQNGLLGGKTMGCIRVTPEAMKQINATNQVDKLVTIVVR